MNKSKKEPKSDKLKEQRKLQKGNSIMYYDFSESFVDWAIKISKTISSFNQHRVKQPKPKAEVKKDDAAPL